MSPGRDGGAPAPGVPGPKGGPGARETTRAPGTARPGATAGPRRRRLEVEYRGVRWRKSVGGTVTWLNEGLGRWVTWYPGSDAPPLPPGWQLEEDLAPAAADVAGAVPGPGAVHSTGALPAAAGPVERKAMRSPFRVAPVVIVVMIVVLAIWQATQSPVKATPQDIATAKSLQGKCLARAGGTASSPKLSATPVSCASPSAAVKVVAVVVPHAKTGPRACPAGAGLVQVLNPGIMDEPVECVEPVKRHG